MKVEYYTGGDGAWRWRVRHPNGNVLADSGQGYSRRIDAVDGLRSLVAGLNGADVEVTFDGKTTAGDGGEIF